MCIHIHKTEIFIESMKADKLFLRRRHSLLKRRPLNWIISSIQQYRWRNTNRCVLIEEIKPWSQERKRHLLPPQSHLTANKRPHNSSSNFCCWLLLWISVLKNLYTIFNGSKPLRQFCYRRGSTLRLWLWFLSFLCFLKGIFDFEFKEAGQDQLMVVVLQQLDDIFSVVHNN